MCIPCAVKYRIESHHSFVALSRFSSIANIVPERWLTQEGVVGRQEREKPTDSRQEEKRTALTALAAEIGREGRLVLCLSRAKGTFPLQWSYTRVLGSSKGSLYLDITHLTFNTVCSYQEITNQILICRCNRPAGNASYSQRIQKTVAQVRREELFQLLNINLRKNCGFLLTPRVTMSTFVTITRK